MASAESLLAKAAEDGSFPSDEWPRTLQYILSRLDEIVDDFPKPNFPLPDPPSLAPPASARPSGYRVPSPTSSQGVEAGDKENAPPATPPRPPVPAFAGSPPSQSASPKIPPQTINLYNAVRTSLSKHFPKHPPHTIQRLAELILNPKRNYRFLPPYLRALDRVVSVTSSATIFPLPQAVLPHTGGLLNGTAPTPPSTLGSDESLGGALLTPIPWLQNRGSQSELISESTEIVDGPNGAGRIETVSVVNGQLTTTPAAQPQHQIASSHPDGESLPSTGPVTQGEILRQEQEAGVLLSNPHTVQSHRPLVGGSGNGATIIPTVEGEEEAPHARGPEAIGVEDTGPQRSAGCLDIEGAVGRPSIERSSRSPGIAAEPKTDQETKDQEMIDGGDNETKDEGEKEQDAEMAPMA